MTRALVLTGLKVWDGNTLVEADALRLQGQKITAVGATKNLLEAGDQQRDCAGLWAMPGLIDAHVHMELDPEQRQPPKHSACADYDAMCRRAAEMVQAGITTARDLGGGSWAELKLRDAIAAGAVPGPTLLCAGQPITTPDGHCHFWGGGAATVDEALAVIDRQREHGVDLIKVMASGGVMTKASQPSQAQFEQDVLNAIVAAAASHHLSVAAHCHSTLSIERATNAGVRTIEHCSWVGPEGWGKGYDPLVVQQMAERGIWVSPTINANWQRHLSNDDPTRRDQLRHLFTQMRVAGVPLAASTDAGIPGVRHQDLPKALPVFQALAALTNEETLQAATRDAATAIGPLNTGQLRAGFTADVLLVERDPRESLDCLSAPIAVFSRGTLVRDQL